MDVVVLRFLGEGGGEGKPVDHAPAHGDGGGHDIAEEGGLGEVTDGVYAPLGEGEVDGFGEV